MKIKEAIKQNKDFKSNLQEVMVNVHFTSSWLAQLNNGLLESYNISMQQYNVLRILKGQHPKTATVKFLIERMLDKSSNASRLVDKLLAKEFVERHQCPSDRRQVDISISKKGLELLKAVDKKFDDLDESFGINQEEARMLSDLLDKMRS